MTIVARVVRVLHVLTRVASQFVAAKDRSPAIDYVRNDFGLAIGKSFKPRLKLPKYIGDFKPWLGSQSRLRVSSVHWV